MNQSAIAEQHQQPPFNEDISFDIDNVTFSHHIISVLNSILFKLLF